MLLDSRKNNFEAKNSKEIGEHESWEEKIAKIGGKQKKKRF